MSNQLNKIKKIALYLENSDKEYNFYILNDKQDESLIDFSSNQVNIILEMNKEVC